MSTKERAPRTEISLKPIDNFVIEEGFNPRELQTEKEQAELQEMAKTLRESYDKDPFSIPTVRGHVLKSMPGKIFVTDGHRRVAAAKIAGIPSLPFHAYSSNLLERLVAVSRLNSGKRLNEMANAKLIMQIQAAYLLENPNAKDNAVRKFIIESMGISQASYYNYLKLTEAPAEVQRLLIEEKVSSTLVRQFMANDNSPEQVLALTLAAIENVTNDVASTETSAPDASQPKKAVKATKAKVKQAAKRKELPFQERPFPTKLDLLMESIVDSGSDGAQMFLQVIGALYGEEHTLEEIVDMVNQKVAQ
jgi:ParB-like chromosome segregation protein Spo0J